MRLVGQQLRFFEGTESDVNETNNVMICSVNTIANYDPAIICYLKFALWDGVGKN
jgi:hypothetical protein